MATSETTSTSHGPILGRERDDRNDPGEGHYHTPNTTELPKAREGLDRESLLATSIWSPPHMLHRPTQHQYQHQHQHQQHYQDQQQLLQHVHPQQHHQHRIYLNPLQYLQHQPKARIITDLWKPPSLNTTAPPSPVDCDSPHSPISRPSSKDSPPISFYQRSDHVTLYHPPHLHFTHQQPVKETHRLDLDFDPISGRKSINNYEIIDEIGRGTHGKVKLGRDLTTDEYVAIKIVERHSRPRLGKVIREEDEKVRREIAILKKCRHPNVVRLIEVIDDPASRKVYLVLEYVELGEIAWRKLGPKDVLRREKNRLKKVLTGESNEGGEEVADSQEERIRGWQQRKQRPRKKQLGKGHLPTGSPGISRSHPQPDENPNFWSLELGGLTEEDDPTDDDYPNVDDDETFVASILDAPHVPPLNSDSVEPSHHISSISLIASSSNPDSPPYSFSHGDLQYVPALTFEQARSTFRDTVLGLEYLHYHGIIHRDIKPANLLWTKNYRVKISDFGVSYLGRGAHRVEDEGDGDKGLRRKKRDQVSGRDEEMELAKTVGTPAFFAPELCFFDSSKPRPHITSAIDVWALGVTLYCLIFARCPFLAEGEFELFNVIAKQELFIPNCRIRPSQGYTASAKLLPCSSSSSRPRSMYHQRITSGGSTKRVSVYGRPMSTYKGTGVSEEQETEVIPNDLRNLLEALLMKDPTKRITIKEVKQHPWVLQDLANPTTWLEATDPERVNGGGRIEVNEEEMEKAVVPASWTTGVIRHVKTGFNKLRKKMGMGGNVPDYATGKDKVGLHPLASRLSDVNGSSYEGAYRPGSSSSNSTLQEQGEVLNRFSLSVQTSTPYNSARLGAPPAASGSILTSLLNISREKPTPQPTNSNAPSKVDRLSIGNGRPNSPSSMKKFLNHSQSSLANSLNRSLSRSSYYSERTATSECASPTQDRQDKILSPSLLRRTRSTLNSGESNHNHKFISEEMGVFGHREVRKAPSSSLGHEITNRPSPSSQSTIRWLPSSSSQGLSTSQIPAMRLATVPSDQSAYQIQLVKQAEPKNRDGIFLDSTTTRSRRSSTSSASNSVSHACEGVTAALGGWFGRGKRIVRSVSRSRDSWASESDAMVSASGGSGDDERDHRQGLRISMLRRKGSNGVEACPEVSRVNASCVRSGSSTAATSPVGHSRQGYFDVVRLAAPVATITRFTSSSRTNMEGSTAITANTITSPGTSSNHLSYHPNDTRRADHRRFAGGYESYDTSCPPSPDDYMMWDQQAKAIDQREVLCKEPEEKIAQELMDGLKHIEKGITLQRSLPPSPHCLQPDKQHNAQLPTCSRPSESHSTSCTSDVDGNLMCSQPGHRQTDTTTSSLTESNSFPSIQSMIESSAASSVSADGGWPKSPKSSTRTMTVTTGVNLDSLLNGNSSDAEDDINQQEHHTSTRRSSIYPPLAQPIPPSIPLPLVSAYSTSMHSKSDEDDGDDEALCLNLGATNRCRSHNLIDPLNRPKTTAIGFQRHYKRTISSSSIRTKASETDREGAFTKEESKKRAQRKKSGVVCSPRRRSRSNTASSSVGMDESELTPRNDRQHHRREALSRENNERERCQERERQPDTEA